MSTKSIFAPQKSANILPVNGVQLSVISCNLKSDSKPDLMLVNMSEGTAVAGLFTQSATTAAPVDWCKKILNQSDARALIVHAGNANACTGKNGTELVKETTKFVATLLDCHKNQVYMAGTGIIGQIIPAYQIINKIDELFNNLTDDAFELASNCIMTTDTYSKGISKIAKFGEQNVIISGIAKGSGMIAPDMATMLCFIFTDAKINSEIIQKLLNRANVKTFANINVDSDTSTNDTILLFATGKIDLEQPITSENDLQLEDFEKKLTEVMLYLALQIVKDGEGISKFITVNCSGAKDENDARAIALSIAESPLVKTAMAGNSPNWGRIIMAIGKAKRDINKKKLKVQFGPYVMAINGGPVPTVDMDAVKKYLTCKEIYIFVDVGIGQRSSTVWTCDLTHAYIDINADYKS
ncbi:MAG: bifunctional glutamate N-acetyltransferase/amino-acid acetyltransferase ArgJ [Piscirickettsiaceae bacterium]|nr:bifunctional glutamate N-acetyltransferase/amino-acid acetyltransferase ArgJ [Piscirickettsiaceae bacterium]